MASAAGWSPHILSEDPGSLPAHTVVVNVINRLQMQVAELQTQLLRTMGGGDKKKELADSKSFGMVPAFDGEEKNFSDFELKLQQCVRPWKHFEEFLDWIKDHEDEPDIDELREKARAQAVQDPAVDLTWYDEQLYNVLGLVCQSTPLQTVKNLREAVGVRGCRSWWQITREVAGKSGVRFERLSDRVHHPKPCASYKDALEKLTAWDNDVKELAKLEGQGLSETTKRTVLKGMVPSDLVRDLERDRTLKTWQDAWRFVLEQVPLRKEWKNKKKGVDDMDVDVAEEDKAEEDVVCKPCEEGDLATLKGGGKGQFQGYCSYCWKWGHKKADCFRLTKDLGNGKGKGDQKGAGKDGGKDQKGKGKGDQKGGWQQKGWSPKGKGKAGYGKGKGGSVYSCIDGDDGSWWSPQQQSYDNGGWFFMLADDDGEESDVEGTQTEMEMESVVVQGPPVKVATFADYWNSFPGKSEMAEFMVENLGEKESGSPETTSGSLTSTPTTATVRSSATTSPITARHREVKVEGTSEGDDAHSEKGYAADLSEPDSQKSAKAQDPGKGSTVSLSGLLYRSLSPKRTVFNSLCFFDDRCLVDMFEVLSGRLPEMRLWDDEGKWEIVDETEPESDEGGSEGPDPVDSSSEDEAPDDKLNEKHRAHRKYQLALKRGRELYGCRDVDATDVNEFDEDLECYPSVDGSVGNGCADTDEPTQGGDIKNTQEAPLKAKPSKVTPKKSSRRNRWRSAKTRAKLNLGTGTVEPCSRKSREFEKMTVGALRTMVDKQNRPVESEAVQTQGLPLTSMEKVEAMDMEWYDHEFHVCYEDEEDKPAEILGFSWRSEPEVWADKKWVKVESVVDSGASSPVAPPTMLPNVKIVPSEGSKRGQKWTSASKHKLKILGEQRAKACTEEGDETELLFQIADVSKPLVSVAAICEKGNRVIFGRSGGVVKNLRTGKEIPFARRNGIYVLSLWLQDGDDAGFARP